MIARALLVALLSAAVSLAASPPNVVLIVADDLGWADLGCYGSKYHKAPHLDKLAAAGMRFTDAYAAAPVCSPTRASIMTGMHPARIGITDWLPGRADRPDQKLARPALVTDLAAEIPTLPGLLKQAGYTTALIGKWHLGGKGAGPLDRGFDINVAGNQAGSPLSYFAPYRVKDGPAMPGLETAPEGEYLTDRLAAEAEKFLDAHKDKPFFLYLPHYAPHIPMKAKAELIAKYKAGQPGQQGNPVYAAMLESLDDAVGRVVKKLDDLKLTEKTIVIFTSDNGGLCTLEGPNTPPTINAPLREGKGYLYEGGIRVPLIVKWPGTVKAGGTNSVPVVSTDLFPTVLDACVTPIGARVDGLSLVPLFEGKGIGRGALFWHYPHYSNQGGRPCGAIRADDWKLVHFFETGRRELFNLKADIGENRNLAADKPDIVKELGDKLASWQKSVGAKMPTANPSFVPNPQDKDGTILLHSRTADIHGTMLRYEPLPHKTTLGYWVNASDWASYDFTVSEPGTFTIEVHQGCGKGQGGSEVEVAVGDQALKFTVEDTGHFQNFKPREIGTVKIDKPGRFTLTIKPIKKAAAAVMDVRQVVLKPAK
ncbi:MAG TPA: sulfatase-like hydrolase/transferase [Gemmataceae bacterium]|nr:sulfatase-like hydrolase/transferase [Gemmataceae bacterium]